MLLDAISALGFQRGGVKVEDLGGSRLLKTAGFSPSQEGRIKKKKGKKERSLDPEEGNLLFRAGIKPWIGFHQHWPSAAERLPVTL